jgi:hypothetical protein
MIMSVSETLHCVQWDDESILDVVKDDRMNYISRAVSSSFLQKAQYLYNSRASEQGLPYPDETDLIIIQKFWLCPGIKIAPGVPFDDGLPHTHLVSSLCC